MSRTRVFADYASDPAASRGRAFAEPEHAMRTPFQRDRDRIVHSTAFRRLKHKTQVFVYSEGDHFRTRLTHTIEVAQVARSLARALGLDEDLTEALALSHDLGHPPFGHAGERALDRCLREWGGFDHNGQSLAVVTRLEKRYPEFDGLNLTWETLEGLVKHNGPLTLPDGTPIGPYEGRKLPRQIRAFDADIPLDLWTFASAEAQAAALADDIAYDSHDTDDGLRARLFSMGQIAEVPLVARILGEIGARYPSLDEARRIHELIRRLITVTIEDAVAETRGRIARLGARNAADIRMASMPVVAFSASMESDVRVLKEFLFTRMYRHPRVDGVMKEAGRVIERLFTRLLERPHLLPVDWALEGGEKDTKQLALRIGDYIAGMTDRYAVAEYQRLFDETPELR
ncbi:MAG: deoxyguanosinetriphosphate triphosphohydrolase [Rhodobiaceae bacterium]|nr:deoxyguanosinetriphosphate triphosphohydrolase [Rhodobiaceae bacterium]MCC0057060.1 deoxyguanosinetriphosphate triphosphohydrolase [Rhodobiaceae bacterium]